MNIKPVPNNIMLAGSGVGVNVAGVESVNAPEAVMGKAYASSVTSQFPPPVTNKTGADAATVTKLSPGLVIFHVADCDTVWVTPSTVRPYDKVRFSVPLEPNPTVNVALLTPWFTDDTVSRTRVPLGTPDKENVSAWNVSGPSAVDEKLTVVGVA
jgi:hypothetical protein